MPSFKTLIAALAAVASTPAAANAFELDGVARLASDYRWRGVTLSDERPSLQLEATGSFDNGAWLWGGVNTVSSEYGGSEVMLGAGLTRELAGVEWTAGLTRYAYPGEDSIDYTELAASAAKTISAVTLSAGVAYVPEQGDFDEDDFYAWAGWDVALPRDLRFHGHVGQTDGLTAPVPYAIDYSLGLALPFRAVEFDVSFVDIESIDGAWVFTIAYAT